MTAMAATAVPGDRRDQELLLQLLAAVAVQRRRGHVALHGDGHRHAAAGDAADLLAEHDGEGVVGALAAVGRVVLDAEQAGGAEHREELVGREPPRGLPLVDVGVDLPVHDVADGLAEEVVLLGEAHAGS